MEKLKMEERRLDVRIREMQEKLRSLGEGEDTQGWLFITEEDIKTFPCFQNEMVVAIKAPHGTTLEVPNPDEGDADYWLLSDADVSTTNMWPESGVDWNSLGTRLEDYAMPSIGTPETQISPESTAAMPSVGSTTGTSTGPGNVFE